METERDISPNIANVAALIGDPARAAILWSLMGGQSRPAGELARIAGISPQAASAHLSQLTQGKLLKVDSKGRHRFFRLSGPEAASAVENLASLVSAVSQDERVVSLVPRPLRRARRCWGHLAGEMGVALHDAFIQRGWVVPRDKDYALTGPGRLALEELGIDLQGVRPGRRGILYPCLDWSERRSHLAGPLADALLALFIRSRWFAASRSSRRLTVTPAGDCELGNLLDAGRSEASGRPAV